MQAEAEESVWEAASLADGRTLAHLYGADVPLVRAELVVEAAPDAAPAAPRADGSLEDEVVTGKDLRPLHMPLGGAPDAGRGSLLTQPGVCDQARPASGAQPLRSAVREQHRHAIAAEAPGPGVAATPV